MVAFRAEPDNALLLSELCERVYRGTNRIEKKHRVAVARAAYRIPWLAHMKRETLGSEVVFYNPASVIAYAMARLKSDCHGRYERHSDPRFQWKKPRSEADFRTMLAPDGDHHKFVVEGGTWWRSAKREHAKCLGDTETVQRLDEEEKKRTDTMVEEIRVSLILAQIHGGAPRRPERLPIAGYALRIAYENGDARVLDFASRRKANHMVRTLGDDVAYTQIRRLYVGMIDV
jgi:hypothetical protein